MANKYLDGNSLLAIKDYIDTPLSEIKSLIYDNQVPAVANLPVPYATNYALPSQISGDKIIMSAGMDMTKVKGRSYVVNQLVKNGNFANSSEWTNNADTFSVTNNVGTITITSTYSSAYLTQSITCVSGHKYLVTLFTEFSRNGPLQIELGGVYSDTLLITANTKTNKTVILEVTANDGLYLYYNRGNTLLENDTVKFSNIALVDLTQWFGSNDAIPADLLANPSLFTKKYWKGELPYDTGHIEDSKPIKIVSVGFNKWDEEWENGGISGVNGSNEANANYFRSKNYIKVIPNKDYYFKGLGTHYLFYYDINKSFISRSSQYFVEDVRTIPQGVYYIRFIKYGTTYNNDICINISDPLLNGKYLPYQKNEYPIIPIQTATIEISTISWNNSGTMSNTFVCGLPNIKHSDNVIASLSNAQYKRYYSTTDLENAESGYYITNNGGLYVKDTNYATAVAFVTANRGTTITYEVANQPYEPLRSALSVQDDNEEVKVGVVDLTSATVNTISVGQFYLTDILQTFSNLVKKPRDSEPFKAIISLGYKTVSFDTSWTNNAMFIDSNGILHIEDDSCADATAMSAKLNGAIMNFELATLIAQSPAFALPENIEIQKGGTIEIEYDDGYSAPCDIDFEVAVSKVLEE